MISAHHPTSMPYTRQEPQQQQRPARTQVFEHTDAIHDTQFDYYGQLLATASSDRTVGIHVARSGHPIQHIASLSGHEGPVWMVSWGHPRFGKVLASVSFDQKAIIWKESAQGWAPIHVIDIHQGSVNAVAWGPDEFGPILATASSDGTVALTAYRDGCWQESVRLSSNPNKISHAIGAMCVSFAPSMRLLSGRLVLASGGCDCRVRLWVSGEDLSQPLRLLQVIEGHSDWVHDVAFCPVSPASRFAVLASCGKDKQILIHRKPWEQIAAELAHSEDPPAGWDKSVVELDEAVWRLSWAPSGQLLVVTTASSQVFLLMEGANFHEPWIVTPLNHSNT